MNRHQVIKTSHLLPQYIFQFMIWNNWQHLSFEHFKYYCIHLKNKKWKSLQLGEGKALQESASLSLSHKTASNVVTSLMTDFLTGGRGGIGCHMLKIARENLFCKWQEPFIEPNIEFIEQLLKRCKTFPNLCCHGLYHWVPGLFICSISPQELWYLSPPAPIPAPGILSRFFLDLQELNLHSKI